MASNDQAALATQAHSCFNAGQYDKALQLLQQISSQMSEEKWEVRVAHNIALAEYARSGFVNSNELQTTLTTISKKAKERNSASGKESKQGEAKTEQTEAEPSILLYNLALLHFQQKRYGECQKILEHLYLNIAPMDEELALHVCFLLLDILIHNARGNLYNPSDQERFAQQMSTILSFLEKPHALNGGGESSSSSDPKKDEDGNADSQRLPEQTEFSFRLHLYKAKILLLQQNVKLSKKEIKSALEIFQRELRESDSNPPSTPNAPPGLAPTENNTANQNNSKANSSNQNNATSPTGNTGLFHPLPPPALQNQTALYLKANLEYLRENYSKCLKLLGTVCGGGPNPAPATPGRHALYYNNLALAHYKMGKCHMALRFFKRALAAVKTDGMDGQAQPAPSPCPGMVTPTYSSEVVYNTGLQLLLLRQPLPAFKCLESAALLFYNRPRLWLRLAECCIMHYTQEKAELVSQSGQQSAFLRAVGVGVGEQRRALLPLRSGTNEPKRLLQEAQEEDTLENVGQGESKSGYSGEASNLGAVHMRGACTLPYATKCLRNVVYLCTARESYKGNEGEAEAAFGNASNLFSSAQESTDGGQGGDAGADDEVLCAALVALAYVQLILSNPVEAHKAASHLLSLGNPTVAQGEEANATPPPATEGQGMSAAHLHRRSLCRLYGAEALVQMGRFHEASDLLAPGGDLEIQESETDDPASSSSSSEMTANLHVGLATIHIKQENYGEAEVHIQTALSLQPSNVDALKALVYILLQQKETRRALQILKAGRL